MVTTNFRRKFGRFRGLATLGRKFPAKICWALAAVLISGPATAFERQGGLDLATVEACLVVPGDREAVADALQRLRWRPVGPADLDAQARNALALYFVSQHVFNAAPDIRLLSAWQRALENVAGVARLAPTPASALYFTSPGGSLLKVNYQQDQWLAGLYCTMILTPEDMAQTLEGVGAILGVPLAELPVFKTLPGESNVDGEARRSFRLTLIDQQELADKIGLEPGFVGIVETSLEAKPPAKQPPETTASPTNE